MPPRVHLSAEETRRLPDLLTRVEALRAQFPHDAGASAQADWIRGCYDHDGAPPSLPLITLLLFEHGAHRSIDQVACTSLCCVGTRTPTNRDSE